MHFGCRSAVGVKMQMSMELFLIELGLSEQPFHESYDKHNTWVTSGWLKSIWEKVTKFGIRVDIDNIVIRGPRDGDQWLMKAFVMRDTDVQLWKK